MSAERGSKPIERVTLDVATLRAVTFLRGVDEGKLAKLIPRARGQVLTRGERLIDDDPVSASIFLVTSGALRLYRLSPMGQEITLLTRHAGDAFGFVTRDAEGMSKTIAAAVVDDTTVFRLPAEAVVRIIVSTPSSARAALATLVRLLEDACDRIDEMACSSVRSRLAHVLASLAADNEERIVRETHEALACRVGASREKVTKEVCLLRESGLVSYEPHHHGMHIPDIERLRAL